MNNYEIDGRPQVCPVCGEKHFQLVSPMPPMMRCEDCGFQAPATPNAMTPEGYKLKLIRDIPILERRLALAKKLRGGDLEYLNKILAKAYTAGAVPTDPASEHVQLNTLEDLKQEIDKEGGTGSDA